MVDLSGILTPEDGRGIDAITQDILDAKRVGGQSILTIGRCLMEAKKVLPHGDWLPWLNEKVEFSESTAQRFMRLARDWSNPSALTDLGASKALALLALPSEEREKFMAEQHDVGGQEKAVVDMTSRELEKAIRERKEALESAEQAKADARAAEEARTRMAADMKVARELLDAANDEKASAHATIESLQKQINDLKSAPVDVAVMAVDQEALDKAKAEAEAGMKEKLEKAKVKLEKAEEKRKAAEEALAAANAKVEELQREARKAVISMDRDLAAFELLFSQAQDQINKLHGMLLKVRNRGDSDLAGKLSQALMALAEQTRGCAG